MMKFPSAVLRFHATEACAFVIPDSRLKGIQEIQDSGLMTDDDADDDLSLDSRLKPLVEVQLQ